MVKLHKLRYDNRHHHIFPNEWKILVPLSKLSKMVSSCLHQFISIEFNDPFKVRIIAGKIASPPHGSLHLSCTLSLSIIFHSTMEIQFGTEFYRSASVNIHFHKVIAIIFFVHSITWSYIISKTPHDDNWKWFFNRRIAPRYVNAFYFKPKPNH